MQLKSYRGYAVSTICLLLLGCSATGMVATTERLTVPVDHARLELSRPSAAVNSGADAIVFELSNGRLYPLANLESGSVADIALSAGCHVIGVSWYRGPEFADLMFLTTQAAQEYKASIVPVFMRGFAFEESPVSQGDGALKRLTVASSDLLKGNIRDWDADALIAQFNMHGIDVNRCPRD